MANKRMFSNTITDSDAFMSMPLSTQALYFHYGMKADDEGFVGNPMGIVRMVAASPDDYKLLKAKGFIIEFESGVIVITHWKQNNYLQNDRVKPTLYKAERSLLVQDKNGVYMLKSSVEVSCIQNVYNLDTNCIQNVSKMDTNCIHSIDKNSIEENSIEENIIEESSIEENSTRNINNYWNEENTAGAREDDDADYNAHYLEFSNLMDEAGLNNDVQNMFWLFLRKGKESGVIYNASMLTEKIKALNKLYGTDNKRKSMKLVRDYCMKRFDPQSMD